MKLWLIALLMLGARLNALTFTATWTTTSTPSPTPTATATFSNGSACPIALTATSIGVADGRGVWDGAYYWNVSTESGKLYQVVSGVTTTVNTYSMAAGSSPTCMTYDGANLWIGSYEGELYEYNRSASLIGSWAVGGPINAILYDGAHVWMGFSSEVARWNASTNAIDLSVTGQSDVAGLSYYTDGGGQEWILAACNGFVSQINATTGAQGWGRNTESPQASITNDGIYAYTLSDVVRKIILSTGGLVTDWNGGNNQIMYDGSRLWTVDINHNTNITDTNGNLLCSYPNTGSSDVCYAYNYNTVFTVDWQDMLSAGSSMVNHFIVTGGYPTPTPTMTSTKTATPTITVTPTPENSVTVSPTWTQTYLGTRTFTATLTVTPSITLTATPHPQWTATASPTPNFRAPTSSPTWGF